MPKPIKPHAPITTRAPSCMGRLHDTMIKTQIAVCNAYWNVPAVLKR